ncbi:MAG: hypothetical protein JNM40_24005 [Myxococcales bacterium]|nr:hypothetical protein [Myxococcales bacterium]
MSKWLLGIGLAAIAGCAQPPTPPMSFSTAQLAREPMDALLESTKKVRLYPATVRPGLIETRWEETAVSGEPLSEQPTKLVRRYVLKMEKHAFGHVVTVEAQAKRCIPQTLRFTESEVEGTCAQVTTLPKPLLQEFRRVTDRLEQLLAIP